MNRRRSSQLSGRDNTLALLHGSNGGKISVEANDRPVHCFLDEHGNWWVYKGDEKGKGKLKIYFEANRKSRNNMLISYVSPIKHNY